MASNENYSTSIGSVGGSAAIGSGAHVGDVNTVDSHDVSDTTTTTTTNSSTTINNLRELAEELAQLREALAAGASTDAQRGAVAELANAEDKARVGDEKGAMAHLKAAGRWALDMASKLALTAAEAAIKVSLGG
jgi:hypothetical protein